MGHLLAVSTESAGRIDGIPTKEPAFGLPALWIEEKDIEQAQVSGYMVVDAVTVVATHLTELIKKHAWELLTRTDVQNLLNNVAKSYPKIVDELIPVHLTLGGVQRVLQNLLRERVPINDLVTILETLLDHAPATKDVEVLTEYARQSLFRYITKQYVTQDGSIPVLTLDPKFERSLYQTVESGSAISPDVVSRMVKGVENIIEKNKMKGVQPIILCSAQSRRFLKRLMEKFLPSVVVLSNAEISPSARLYTMGMVKYED
jgi:flagellar biosynthesis protein FlhA